MSKVNDLDIKIGLEVHCQLTKLNTKLFCSCSSDYRGKDPNTHICPICMGIPGTLPTLNAKALEDATKVALALNSKISERMLFFRKNYFYPDLPKNFQISQYDKAGGVPFSIGGEIKINDKSIKLIRVQIEEDPGKLNYEGSIESSICTLVDYNRAGIALIEIVTEPDIKTPKEARVFLEKLRLILENLNVSDDKLEGAMRCDANISLGGGNRIEIKNISSFKEVERALKFEITRQKRFMERGITLKQETRHWDEVKKITISLRIKEEEQDYRYFPEPDLVPVSISRNYLEEEKHKMPELFEEKLTRFVKDYSLSKQNSEILIKNSQISNFFEECIQSYHKPRELCNLIIEELLPKIDDPNMSLSQINIKPKHIIELLHLIENKNINRNMAKSLFQEMLSTGKMPSQIVKEKSLEKIIDYELIEENVERVLKENPQAVEDALMDENAINYLMGQLMKITKGKVDPQIGREIINKKITKKLKRTK